jgi:hypothetical protein
MDVHSSQACEQVKKELLQRIRELMLACDQTMKAVTVSYWQLMHTITAAEPVQYQQLADKTKQYEIGSQYAEFVGSLRDSPNTNLGTFTFIPFDGDQLSLTTSKTFTSSSSATASTSRSTAQSSASKFDINAKHPSDSESAESAGEETTVRLVPGNGSSGEELDDLNYAALSSTSSSAASSHQFRLLRTPSRCRNCDNICFQGFECVSVSSI